MIVVQLRAWPQEASVSLCVTLLSSKNCAGQDYGITELFELEKTFKIKFNCQPKTTVAIVPCPHVS